MSFRYRIDPTLPRREVAAVHRALQADGGVETDGDDWDFSWDGGIPDSAVFDSLSPRQRVNRFPDLAAFGNKSDLHDNLAASRGFSGQRDRRIHAQSFAMPEGYPAWQNEAACRPEQLWLLKPKALSCGREISLIRDLETVPRDDKWMVQEYLDRPHLLSRHKYVLRFYLAITSLDPLLCYLHRNGVCKLASRPYTLDPESLDDSFVHLTNPPVQKLNTEVPWGALNCDLATYRQRLRKLGVDDERLFAEIREAILRMAIACREQALLQSRAISQRLAPCFELLGVDVLVDDQLKPWIIECNVGPSLAVADGYDPKAAVEVQAAKDQAVIDLIHLLDVASGAPAANDAESWQGRAGVELENAAGYERIWPARDSGRFVAYFPLLRPLDRLLSSAVCPGIDPVEPLLLPVPSSEVHLLGDGVAVFDGRPDRLFVLNTTGAALWMGLVEGGGPEVVIGELTERFPTVPRSRIEAEVWDLLVAWAQHGLLRGYEIDEGKPTEGDGLDSQAVFRGGDGSDRGDPTGSPSPVVASGRCQGELLVVDCAGLGLTGAGRLGLPLPASRQLVLLVSGKVDRPALRIATASSALESLLRSPASRVALTSPGVAALTGWLDRIELFEIESAGDGNQEVEALISILSPTGLV